MDTMEINWRQFTDHATSSHITESHLMYQCRNLQEAGLKSGMVPASIPNTYQAMYRTQEQVFLVDSIEVFALTRLSSLYCLLQP